MILIERKAPNKKYLTAFIPAYSIICWGGVINTFEQAKAVASLWADATSIMLNTGRSFDEACRELRDKEGF